MQTQLADKIRTLTANHEDLTALINGDKFRQLNVDTQESLLELHRVLDSQMQAMSRQVDALDQRLADVFLALER